MKRIFTLSTIVKSALFSAGLIASASVWSQPFARWTFEGVTFNTPASQTPSLSAGSTVADDGAQTAGSAFTGFHTSASTVYSTPAGNGSTKSFSSNNWTVGDYYQFQVNTTGKTGISLVYDQTNSTTGPVEFKVQYSTDGTTYTDFVNYTSPNNAGTVYAWTSGSTVTSSTLTFNLNAITALNNKPAVYFRLVNRSTVTVSGGVVASGGTARVDNFAVWETAILPLSLTGLNASLLNGKANLAWTSVNEASVNGFSVEKSLNGTSFSEIAFVKANNAASNTYTAEDVNVKAGANFYRLKAIDINGSVRFSNVVVINNRTGIKTSLFPNPVVSSLSVSHDKADAGAVIRIMSMEGRQVKYIPVQAGAVQTAITVSDLIKGNYLLVFETNGEKSTSKFTKQ